MTYAIFLLVTAVCAFGLNYLTNKICPAMVVINKSRGSNVHALRCITLFLLLLVTLWLPVKPAVINLAVEFAALVNFIASVTLYTVANLREKRRLKKQRKEEKAAKKG
ncbi:MULTISPECIES: hypothetical protein [Klebsiella/Raoultella group]|jgi:uncharacterized protein (DUF2062 family)|uniref:hypothetical protein n=1 Tax=Klebsiella/Raoultella group TaxID=2890311 RepID=UPI00024FE75C|nr:MULTISPECIES: hypothetical protein [Klebsiella/Raoultella group]HCT4440146.1 hypothetical protein [Klebsiella aerogenes]EHS88055.1 hypothetical protein HMPREF9689_05460 [Klebsiella oxytoca 10-5245]KMV79768.1 hypothetical protein HMPREF9692_05437 [Klebsiella oxytoca 10-5248]MBX4774845.1 hypothetical protein [Klebsiella oxytoca]MBZ7653576.1 hypothetical protein [Klebsiella grimontii]